MKGDIPALRRVVSNFFHVFHPIRLMLIHSDDDDDDVDVDDDDDDDDDDQLLK